MKGTERQIAYATKIKHELDEGLKYVIWTAEQRVKCGDFQKEYLEIAREVCATLQAKIDASSAKEIIENAPGGFNELVRQKINRMYAKKMEKKLEEIVEQPKKIEEPKKEEIAHKHGTVEHKGQTLVLTQQPYLGHENYVALATDDEENEYLVYWGIINPDCEDESDACDWEEYTVRAI